MEKSQALNKPPKLRCPLSLQGSMVRPGFGFMRDGASLGMLREMLVMIRIWGLLKAGCLPTFTATSDNQDSMQLLFRLLTKLWLCCKNQHPGPGPGTDLGPGQGSIPAP